MNYSTANSCITETAYSHWPCKRTRTNLIRTLTLTVKSAPSGPVILRISLSESFWKSKVVFSRWYCPDASNTSSPLAPWRVLLSRSDERTESKRQWNQLQKKSSLLMSGIIVTSVNFTVAHETKTNAKSSEFRRQISLTLGLQLDPVIHTLTPTHTLTHSVVVAFGGRETGSGSASSLL